MTQYLTETGVRKTLGVLAKAGSGSRLLFTYMRKDLEGPDLAVRVEPGRRRPVYRPSAAGGTRASGLRQGGPRRSRTWNEPFTTRSFEEPSRVRVVPEAHFKVKAGQSRLKTVIAMPSESVQ
ncbi:hypothetical protein [Amycolatopsis sp. NPDC057786]|uniref:hypothetical protein n=1 Tax=Amycolatopsis sp. NPDC057786 TaxID=3346250 RepID=UPI003670A294